MRAIRKAAMCCRKCGQRFEHWLAMDAHLRQRCLWTCRRYPNGSFEMSHDMAHTGWIEAPNPFGGTWTMTFQNRIYGAGGNPDAQGIHRRGRKWYPRFEHGVGWSWIAGPGKAS